MISCEKAAIICNKAQYKNATGFEKIKLRLHTLYCRACASYIKKNTRLTSLCEKANLKALSVQDKLQMKEELQKNI